jgi:hypothetical protein
VDRRVLGEDRDALLALQITGVHGAFLDVLVLAERTALPEHLVDKGGLAVVDVGDDGDVTNVATGAPERGGSLRGHDHHSLR